MKVTTDACLFGAWVAAQISNNTSLKNMLDIGSGTGLLSLMLAQKSVANIDAIELQQKDYLQSVQNIEACPWKERINIIHGDAAQYSFPKKYDLIISNPPFYENDLKSNNNFKNIAHHDTGLTLITLLQIVRNTLQPQGSFYILLPAKRSDELQAAIQHSQLHLHQITMVHATGNHTPFRMMAKIGFTREEVSRDSMMIKRDGCYSEEFISLLSDYYLKL